MKDDLRDRATRLLSRESRYHFPISVRCFLKGASAGLILSYLVYLMLL